MNAPRRIVQGSGMRQVRGFVLGIKHTLSRWNLTEEERDSLIETVQERCRPSSEPDELTEKIRQIVRQEVFDALRPNGMISGMVKE